MKKTLVLALTVLLATFAQGFAQEYGGKLFKVGNIVTTLETGKHYFLYNNNTQKYVLETAAQDLTQAESPEELSASANMGYIFMLEESGTEGKYYIKTGNGKYMPNPGTSEKSTQADGYALTITSLGEGHFTIKGNMRWYIAPTNGANLKGGAESLAVVGGTGDWSFYAVEVTEMGEMKGKALYDYVISTDPILVRLNCKRNESSYLTSTTSGSAYGSTLKKSGLSQVWIKEQSGSGYTFRNAETAEYLQSSFGEPATSSAELYVQYSPNNTNTNTDAWCNISSKSDFSGSTCLNLGNDGKTLYKWSYAGDAGCDWKMNIVSDVTETDVSKHLNELKGWASEIEDGAYYRIISTAYEKHMTESDGGLTSKTADYDNLLQTWIVRKSGEGYTFQNVVTDNYAGASSGRSQQYKTTATAKTLYVTRSNDKWLNTFKITTGKTDTQGYHTASSQSYMVVQWDTDADASYWAFEKVELTQEQIEEAKAGQKEYENLVKNKVKYQAALTNFFKDYACSELKDEVLAMTDEQLKADENFQILPSMIQNMVLKVKNNTWQIFENQTTGYTRGYEEFFRVAEYGVYSNHSSMCWQTGQSNAYGKLSNPTGIIAKPSDVLIIYVDQEPSSDCTLQVELVSTEGVPGNHQTGSCTDLHKGINIVNADDEKMVYIFYQLNDVNKYLANYKPIKIHIEGGQLHGYWDATRGMTNEDWKLLQQSLLDKCDFLNLKTTNLVHAVHGAELKRVCPDNIEGVTKIWNKVVSTEEKYQGLESFEGRCNNIWNVFTVDYNYMFATTYGTYYHWNTMSSIYDYYNLTHSAGALWGPAHEMGHNHQSTFNMISCMEVSNNLFPNICVWEQGISDTRGYNVESNFAYLPGNQPWLDRNIWDKTRLYFQLYLYFHVMHNNDRFYQDFFTALRKNGMKKNGNNSLGKDDYLHFYKTVCDVAQLDMTEFFEAYGFFVPITDYKVEDYANYIVNTTQADVDAAKAYVAKKGYPKAGNVMFINDKVEQKPSEPNDEWESVTSSSLRAKYPNDDTTGWYLGPKKLGGDFESYTPNDKSYKIDGDYYTLSSSTISFKGTGWMGHKFYDRETGRLIWATNKAAFTLPTAVKNADYYVVAAEANGGDVPCPFYQLGKSKYYKLEVHFADGTTKIWNVNDTDGLMDLLPEGAWAVYIDTKEMPEILQNDPRVTTEGTGISEVAPSASSGTGNLEGAGRIFNLAGQRVGSNLQKGVYIIDGKKIMR